LGNYLGLSECIIDVDEEYQPHRRDIMYRLARKIRDRINCKTDDLMPARKVRKRRSRRKAFSGNVISPRKILGSRFRVR